MQSNKVIIGVVAIFILAVLGFAIMYYSGAPADESLSVSGPNATDTPQMIANREFLVILGKFENIHLATSTFTDKVFLSLEDEGVVLQEEPFTRVNPFAPIGAEGGTVLIQNGTQNQNGLQSQFGN